MRAWISSSAAILGLLCLGQIALAQSPPAEKKDAPQALTGPGGSAQHPSDAAKKTDSGQSAAGQKDVDKKGSEPGKPHARIGTLSPDEQRRADRARKRASSATKSVPEHAAGVDRSDRGAASAPQPERKTIIARPSTPQKTRRVARDMPRKVATSDMRPDKGQREIPRWRRSAERSWHGPRVGDIVPPGVRLYRLPPGYGPGYATAADLPPYARRLAPPPGFPPYPHYRYDEGDFDE